MEICAEKTKLNYKQCQWHLEGDQGNRIEAGYRNNLQEFRASCFR